MHRDRVLASLLDQERPVVFVGPYEHHSNEVTWRETLAEVVEVPLCPRGNIDLAALRDRLKVPRYAGRPKIGWFSAASNVTGLLTDTRSVARLLHAHGAFAFFDFAGSGPYVDIDMKPDKADGDDAAFLSPHKFVGGPGTPGLLCFQAHLYALAVPSTAGGGTVRSVTRNLQGYVDDNEAREDAGTPAILGKIRTALAFKVKEELGTDAITRREHHLFRRAAERPGANPQVRLLNDLLQDSGARRVRVRRAVRSYPPEQRRDGQREVPAMRAGRPGRHQARLDAPEPGPLGHGRGSRLPAERRGIGGRVRGEVPAAVRLQLADQLADGCVDTRAGRRAAGPARCGPPGTRRGAGALRRVPA